MASVTALAIIALVLAAIAAARRLVRTAGALAVVGVLAVAGPQLLQALDGPLDELRDAGVDVRAAVDTIGAIASDEDATSEDATSARGPEAVDGDTFHVREDGEQVSVRVALVDAGESSSARYGRPTCGGTQATRFAEEWADRRKSVRLQRVAGLPRTDRYDRRLARVVDTKNRDYGLAAVRDGWARVTVYEDPTGDGADYLDRLRTAEKQARDANRGAWATCNWRDQEGVK